MTYTFQLRTDAKWSDGSAVTAGDFVYAWRRLVDPETNSPNADALAMVAGYDKAVLGDTEALQVSAPDDHTLVVVLSGSYPSFIESTCTSAVTMPVQEKAVTGHDNWSVSSLWFMGNGAYERTGDWSDSTRLTLHTRAAYYDVKRLGPDRIDIQLKDRQAADASAGKVDIVIGAGGEDAQQGGDPTVGILLLNQMATSMSRSELRRALSLVIDRNAVAEAMGQDYTAAEGLVPYGILTASGEEFRVVNGTRIDNDPDKYEERCQGALALLRQAGYSNAVSLSALDTVTLAYDRTSDQAQAAQQLQQLWEAQLGIKVQLVGLESFELKQRLANGEFVIALMEMTARNNDAAAYLDPWRSTDMRNYGMLYLNAYDILMKIAATSNSQEAEDAYLPGCGAAAAGDGVRHPAVRQDAALRHPRRRAGRGVRRAGELVLRRRDPRVIRKIETSTPQALPAGVLVSMRGDACACGVLFARDEDVICGGRSPPPQPGRGPASGRGAGAGAAAAGAAGRGTAGTGRRAPRTSAPRRRR